MSSIDEIKHAKASLQNFEPLPPQSEKGMVRFGFHRINRRGYAAYLLASFFMKLPVDAKLVRVSETHYDEVTYFFVESEKFPPLREGYEPVAGTVLLQREPGPGDTFMEFLDEVSWDKE